MGAIENLIIDFLLNFTSADAINNFLRDPRTTATIVGCLVAISGALLGTFLLLRKMSLTSDALSHTILLGIVAAFLIMVNVFHQTPDLSSPWLIVGAALAGVGTVILTELIYKSGLVKQDAALGLAFPLLFAVSIILISRYVDNIHLDQDAVIVGEIGVTWANTNAHCLENCDEVVVTPDSPLAETGRQCINCQSDGIHPRSDEAIFEEYCSNCGTYTASQAWSAGLIDQKPTSVFFPKSITVMGVITLINLLFVTLLYKELKLSTFDAALAKALGFRPGVIHYGLMMLVSVTAVGAFDAVGSVLVIAFFIIPPAAAYLLTDRLSRMLVISPIIGGLGAYTGYDLARGNFLGIIHLSDLLKWLDKVIGLGGYTTWNTSISASMVIMIAFFFVVAWVFSPRYGLILMAIRRQSQRRNFADQIVLGHIYHHQDTPEAADELAVKDFHTHFKWSKTKMQSVMTRLRALNHVQIHDNFVALTERGAHRVETFERDNLAIEQA
jgi:manganese/zinc/iron transport system permease protein